MKKVITILKNEYSHTIMKSDVWLIFTKNKEKPYVIEPNGISENGIFFNIILAAKREG